MKKRLRDLLTNSLPGPLPPFEIEWPKVKEHGDLSANIALVLSRQKKSPPQKVAEEIVRKIRNSKSEIRNLVEKIDVKNGFINFTFKKEVWQESLREIEAEGENFGQSDSGKGRKVLVEFVSANPTGPIHIGNARGGPLGDAIASLLEATGYDVTREYYVNDVGGQIDQLGKSIRHFLFPDRTSQEEGGYYGSYVQELAERFRLKYPDKLKTRSDQEFESLIPSLGEFGVQQMLQEISVTCDEMDVHFDEWIHEKDILKRKTPDILRALREKKVTVEKEGAVWLATRDEFLQDRECVLVRSDGRPTYFANDIAYHLNKYERGFDRIIDIWGSNHHGHVPRVKAALQSLGLDPEKLEVVLYQYVRVKRGAEAVKMSKRGGNFVTAKEVLDEVGRDAFRFFLLMRAPESHLDFDLELAKRHSQENPVYYVQYAHARLASIFRKWEERGGGDVSPSIDLSRLDLPEELSLIRLLHRFPEEIALAAARFEPHRIPFYLLELAKLFQSYYTKAREDPRYRVIGSDIDTTRSKL